MLRVAVLAPVTLGSAIGLTALRQFRKPVMCESGIQFGQAKPVTLSNRVVTNKGVQRFNGKLDYHQLTYGSIIGILAGWTFGKISKILATFVIGSFITLQYLEYAKIIDADPIVHRIYKWSWRNLSHDVLVDNPSFKLSFASSFIIAAVYS